MIGLRLDRWVARFGRIRQWPKFNLLETVSQASQFPADLRNLDINGFISLMEGVDCLNGLSGQANEPAKLAASPRPVITVADRVVLGASLACRV